MDSHEIGNIIFTIIVVAFICWGIVVSYKMVVGKIPQDLRNDTHIDCIDICRSHGYSEMFIQTHNGSSLRNYVCFCQDQDSKIWTFVM